MPLQSRVAHLPSQTRTPLRLLFLGERCRESIRMYARLPAYELRLRRITFMETAKIFRRTGARSAHGGLVFLSFKRERRMLVLTSRWCFSRIRLSRDRTSIHGRLRRKTGDLQPKALRLVQRSMPGFPCRLQHKREKTLGITHELCVLRFALGSSFV